MRHSTAKVIELNAAKRLILKQFELVIRNLMHISGLIDQTSSPIQIKVAAENSVNPSGNSI
jgi:hypothetical protein